MDPHGNFWDVVTAVLLPVVGAAFWLIWRRIDAAIADFTARIDQLERQRDTELMSLTERTGRINDRLGEMNARLAVVEDRLRKGRWQGQQ